MINRKWMNEFAEKVATCPKCHQRSFCLIFVGEDGSVIWECAESNCLYNPAAIQRRFK